MIVPGSPSSAPPSIRSAAISMAVQLAVSCTHRRYFRPFRGAMALFKSCTAWNPRSSMNLGGGAVGPGSDAKPAHMITARRVGRLGRESFKQNGESLQ